MLPFFFFCPVCPSVKMWQSFFWCFSNYIFLIQEEKKYTVEAAWTRMLEDILKYTKVRQISIPPQLCPSIYTLLSNQKGLVQETKKDPQALLISALSHRSHGLRSYVLAFSSEFVTSLNRTRRVGNFLTAQIILSHSFRGQIFLCFNILTLSIRLLPFSVSLA